jgi:hypothetical protein
MSALAGAVAVIKWFRKSLTCQLVDICAAPVGHFYRSGVHFGRTARIRLKSKNSGQGPQTVWIF